MKYWIVLLLAATLIIGIFVVERRQDPAAPGLGVQPEQEPQLIEEARLVGTESGSLDDSVGEPATVANSTKRYEEVLLALGGAYTDTECIFGTRYVPDQEAGVVREVTGCLSLTSAGKHPYDDYSTETLKSLSYADPIAAVVLGKRLTASDVTEATSLMIRAAALSGGQPLPIDWISDNVFSATQVNGVPQLQSIETRYILKEVASRLGSPTANVQRWREKISEVHEFSEEDIERLNIAADEIVGQMRTIERQVAGTNNI
jgi:hypothetical protein